MRFSPWATIATIPRTAGCRRRKAGLGFVPAENLMARADVMLGSYDFLNAHAPVSWLGQFRLSRFLRLI